MAMIEAPQRLLETGAGDPLAALVRAAAADSVDVDVDHGLARLHACSVHGELPAHVLALARARPAPRGWLWFGTGALTLAVVAIAIVAARLRPAGPVDRPAHLEVTNASQSGSIRPPPAANDEPSEPPAPTPTSVIAPVRSASAARVDPIAPPRVRAPRLRTPAPARTEPAPRAEGPDDVAREARLLRRTRERLDAGDYDEAIALCELGDADHPRGLLAEERLGLRVLAQVLRQDAGARVSAARYLVAHPRGAIAGRIARAVEAVPRSPADVPR